MPLNPFFGTPLCCRTAVHTPVPYAPPSHYAQDALHPMFPDEDEALEAEWDEYGAVLAKDEFRVRAWPWVHSTRGAFQVVAWGAEPQLESTRKGNSCSYAL